MSGHYAITASFIVYLAAVLAIGVIAYRRTRHFSDYILGGRRLGSVVTALSAGASDMSGWLLLGLPGYAYLAGFEAGWIALGLLIGTWLNWRLVAARLRRATEAAGDALTLPAYFEGRFGDRTRLVRPVAAVMHAGGVEGTLAAMQSANPARCSTRSPGRRAARCHRRNLAARLGARLLRPAAYPRAFHGDPRHDTTAARARRLAMTWVTVTLAGALTVGLAGIPVLDPPLAGADTEKVFIDLVGLLLHPVVAGFCLAAILAAIMSTADSPLLVASSALSEDLYRVVARRPVEPRRGVWLGRTAVIVVSAAALLLALDPESMVLDLVAYAWAGFGAAFGPAILLSLYWPRMTGGGALAGIVTGGATVIVWKQLSGGIFEVYEIVPGFLLSMLAIVAVSLIERRTGKTIAARLR